MRNPDELVAAAKKAIAKDDYDTVVAIVCEALKHLSDFCFKADERWDRDTVKECCYDIGELIYEDGEIEKMKAVYTEVYYEMRGVAARYLEHFWDGCGDGEWRG